MDGATLIERGMEPGGAVVLIVRPTLRVEDGDGVGAVERYVCGAGVVARAGTCDCDCVDDMEVAYGDVYPAVLDAGERDDENGDVDVEDGVEEMAGVLERASGVPAGVAERAVGATDCER